MREPRKNDSIGDSEFRSFFRGLDRSQHQIGLTSFFFNVFGYFFFQEKQNVYLLKQKRANA